MSLTRCKFCGTAIPREAWRESVMQRAIVAVCAYCEKSNVMSELELKKQNVRDEAAR